MKVLEKGRPQRARKCICYGCGTKLLVEPFDVYQNRFRCPECGVQAELPIRKRNIYEEALKDL